VQLALDFKNKKKIKNNRPIFKKIAQFNLNIVRQLMMMHFDRIDAHEKLISCS